jgi:hypothetical protein
VLFIPFFLCHIVMFLVQPRSVFNAVPEAEPNDGIPQLVFSEGRADSQEMEFSSFVFVPSTPVETKDHRRLPIRSNCHEELRGINLYFVDVLCLFQYSFLFSSRCKLIVVDFPQMHPAFMNGP